MYNLAAIVTVRALSTRLKEKCFQTLHNDLSMIEIVIKRAKKIGCTVILATSNHSSDDGLVDIALKENIKFFRGSMINKIHRWKKCFDEFDIDYAMLIDADDPSFSFSLAKRCLNKISENNYEFLKGSIELMPGFITYGISKPGIKKLFKQAPKPDIDTDVIDYFLNKAKLNTYIIEPLKGEKFVDNVRLTVDYREDVVFYQKLFNYVSYLEESSKMIKVVQDKRISKINWFRHKEFLTNQENFTNDLKNNRGVN